MSLTPNSLKDTIRPLISVDEFDAKSGETQEVIVIGFYSYDEEPAQDLNTFIQRGSFNILDAEVSPNPDEDGYYLIFVEFERTAEFDKMFYKFIKDIENVTGEQKWQVKPYLIDRTLSLYDPDLFKYIITEPSNYVAKDEFTMDAKVEESLRNSCISNLTTDGNYVIITDNNSKIAARVIDFGTFERMSVMHRLSETAIKLSSNTEIATLASMLGESWSVHDLGKVVALENENNEILLVDDVHFKYGL
jgi:PHD/YefM family antitoxin component YafN of YafNO toxin-antitoxin module